MDNEKFLSENKKPPERSVSVIPPRPGVDQPFTTQLIRDGLTRVATGQIDHTELAEQLNQVAFNFYNKKK